MRAFLLRERMRSTLITSQLLRCMRQQSLMDNDIHHPDCMVRFGPCPPAGVMPWSGQRRQSFVLVGGPTSWNDGALHHLKHTVRMWTFGRSEEVYGGIYIYKIHTYIPPSQELPYNSRRRDAMTSARRCPRLTQSLHGEDENPEYSGYVLRGVNKNTPLPKATPAVPMNRNKGVRSSLN